jgi:hypothetical protein
MYVTAVTPLLVDPGTGKTGSLSKSTLMMASVAGENVIPRLTVIRALSRMCASLGEAYPIVKTKSETVAELPGFSSPCTMK